MIFPCCFHFCDKQSYMLWIKTPNSVHYAAFPRQRLNARFSCWHNLRLKLILLVSIRIFGNMSLCRKRFSKINICENKRLSIAITRASLLKVYHFVDKILLERLGKKTLFDFLFLMPNEHVFYLFLVPPYKVKTPYRSAIFTFLQLGHEVTPNYREKNLICTTYF